MPLAVGGDEKRLVFVILLQERSGKFRTDLIGALGDRRPDSGHGPGPPGTERFHRLDDRRQDTAKGSLPTGVSGADDSRIGVGEQNRRTIRAENSENDAGTIRHHRVGPRRRSARPLPFDPYRRPAVHLIDRIQRLARQIEMAGDAAAVLRNGIRMVLRTQPDIERRVNPVAHPALAGEECVPDWAVVRQRVRREARKRI